MSAVVVVVVVIIAFLLAKDWTNWTRLISWLQDGFCYALFDPVYLKGAQQQE